MDIPFLPARYLTVPPTPRDIGLIVIHSAEVKEGPGQATWLMNYCANEDRKASWHFAVDADAITQSVKIEDIAWHAGHTANLRGVGIELATWGMPTAEQWADDYNKKMLSLAAFFVAGLCKKLNIDPFYVDAAGLLEGRRGITTHAQCSLAFKETDHMDPGPDFPMDAFIADVTARLSTGNYQA